MKVKIYCGIFGAVLLAVAAGWKVLGQSLNDD